MSATDIADFEARLAEDDITFDLARDLLDAIKSSRAEVAALRRQVEERGDAAPEFDVNRLDGLEGAWAEGNLRVYIAGARAGWEKCASLIRIPPGEVVATPPPDVVTVPREEWAVAQILSNAWRRHPLTCGERDKLVSEWDALRSGEAQERKP